MTRQYVVGELSLILGELEAAATSEAALHDLALLRHEVERTSPGALAAAATRATELSEGMCWDALARGEIAAFIRETTICAELWEFRVCAGLLEEEPTRPAGA